MVWDTFPNMKTPRLLLAVLFASGLALASSWAAEGWKTDYKAALELAAKEDKLVLLDFTGSDWCPPCIKLHKDVFEKPELATFAKGNLVPVMLDFPRAKEISPEIKQQNEALAAKFTIEGYPTLILLDSKGNEVARRVGYQPGGPEAFIKWVESTAKK